MVWVRKCMRLVLDGLHRNSDGVMDVGSRYSHLRRMRKLLGLLRVFAGTRRMVPCFARIRGGRLSLWPRSWNIVVCLIAGDPVEIFLSMGTDLGGGACSDKPCDLCPISFEKTKALQHAIVLGRGPHLTDLCSGVGFSRSRGSRFGDRW